jgi:hypothetical protein
MSCTSCTQQCQREASQCEFFHPFLHAMIGFVVAERRIAQAV